MAGKRKYTINEHAFSKISPEAAYWLGFITADGCVMERNHSKIISFTLHKQDDHLLKKFKIFISSNHPLHYYPGCNNGNGVSFSISSTPMFNDIVNYGIVPRKTYSTNSFIRKIPDEYKQYFISGLFDGDGTVIVRNKGVTPSSPGNKTYYYNLCEVRLLSNYNTLEDISKYLKKYYNFKYLKVKNVHKNLVYCISWYSKNDLLEFHKLYSLSPIKLMRKYYKLEEFIRKMHLITKNQTKILSFLTSQVNKTVRFSEVGHLLNIPRSTAIGSIYKLASENYISNFKPYGNGYFSYNISHQLPLNL